MFNVSFVDGFNNMLPIGMIMTYPLWLVEISQIAPGAPSSIEAQGWLLAVVGAAMGLVKIALWLRNYKDDKTSPQVLQNIDSSFQNSLSNLTKVIEKLTENDEKLAENQHRALENHSRLLEAITLMKMQLQGMENNLISAQERRAMSVVTEIKDAMRNK